MANYFDNDTQPGDLKFKFEVEYRLGNKAFVDYVLKRN